MEFISRDLGIVLPIYSPPKGAEKVQFLSQIQKFAPATHLKKGSKQ
jgi:hypothetical protein